MKRRKYAQEIIDEMRVSAFTEDGDLEPELVDQMLDTVNERVPEARPFLDKLFPFVKALYEQAEQEYLDRFSDFLCSTFDEEGLEKLVRWVRDDYGSNDMISGLQMLKRINIVEEMHHKALHSALNDFEDKLQRVQEMPVSEIKRKLEDGELDVSIKRALKKAKIA